MEKNAAAVKKVYIDYNATTPLNSIVKTQMIEDMDLYGNASSMHECGRLAFNRIEKARSQVAKLIGAQDESIIFTSGGSEANNTVFYTMKHFYASENELKNKRNEIIISAIEHPCVRNSAGYPGEPGLKIIYIPVDEYGSIIQSELKKALSDKTLFVSVMMANNEIGTIQDIAGIGRLVKACGAWFHSDAVQAAGKIPVNVDELGVDYLTLSSHKIYGPKGVGALYVRKGVPFFPLIRGGHQENGKRAGTYNTAGILGFGTAAQLALEELDKYRIEISELRDRLKNGLSAAIPGIKINGHPEKMLPNTLNVSFPGAEGEAILLSLDIAGIEASTGSACASGSLEPSHVLMAIGAGPELAHSSIRFSLGWGITQDDIDYIIKTTQPIIQKLREMSTI
jgi:cysteine desulfurase